MEVFPKGFLHQPFQKDETQIAVKGLRPRGGPQGFLKDETTDQPLEVALLVEQKGIIGLISRQAGRMGQEMADRDSRFFVRKSSLFEKGRGTVQIQSSFFDRFHDRQGGGQWFGQGGQVKDGSCGKGFFLGDQGGIAYGPVEKDLFAQGD